MIRFKRIYGENFNSFEKIDFQIVPGKHLITGKNLSSDSSTSNESGKSSIVELLTWTGWKKSPKGKDPSRDYKGNCKTGMEFDINNNEYHIERYKDYKELGDVVKLYVGGDEVSHRLPSQTEEEIQKLLDIPYDLLTCSIIIMQGMPINFSMLTPTLRKQVIEDMLKFSVWDDFNYKVQKFIELKKVDEGDLQDQFNKEKNKMIEINTEITTLEQVKTESEKDIESEIIEIKSKIRDIQPEIDKLLKEEIELFNGRDIKSIIEEGNTLSNSLSIIKSNYNDNEQMIKDSLCVKCGQTFPEEMMDRFKKELPRFQVKIDSITELINDIEKLKQSLLDNERLRNKYKYNIDLHKDKLNTLANRTIVSDEKIDSMKKSLEDIKGSVNGLNQDLTSMQKNIEHGDYLKSLLMPSSKFRTNVLDKYLNYINQLMESITPLILDDTKVTLTVDKRGVGIDILINKAGKNVEYKSLSGGGKRRIDIIIILAFQKFLIEVSNIKTNLIVFDEIFDSLDNRGIDCILGSLDTLFGEDIAIYVISHQDHLKSSFDSVITVIKENDISRVEYHDTRI